MTYWRFMYYCDGQGRIAAQSWYAVQEGVRITVEG
jgi:hypothetical protein